MSSKKLSNGVRRHLRIHLDGARLSNAVVHLQCTFREMTTDLGVDIICLEELKNGLMMGEAITICNPSLARDFQYIRKQSLHLPSKSRYLATQFLAYFKDNLWKTIATHSLSMTQLLDDRI